MISRERVFALLECREADCLPAMPITMMFAADQVGPSITTTPRAACVQAEGQIRVAEKFGVDHVLISPRFYDELVFPNQKKMIDGIHGMGARARLHICGDTRHIQEGLGRVGADIVDQDSLAPFDEARSKMGPQQVLLGNIDPVRVLRNGTPASVYEAVARCHRQAGPRYIVGAGCEVVRDTPSENMQALLRYAREHAPSVVG